MATRGDGLPPLEGKALAFPSLDFMVANYLRLWNSLSKDATGLKRLQQELVGSSFSVIPPKLSASSPGYPGVKGRNLFQTDLQMVSDLVMEDITKARELETRFLSDCYCQSGSLSQYSLISKTILQARYAALFDSESPGPSTLPAVEKDGISRQLTAESLSRRPVILIGDAGVGKTSFIRHLIKVDAVSIFEKAVTLYIDLGSQATLESDLQSFILEEIERQLLADHGIDIYERNFVRGVYNVEIQRFGKGIYSDLRDENPSLFKEKQIEFIEGRINNKPEHLKLCLHHLVEGRKRQIVIFIDNADQRDDQVQQSAFLIAQELSAHWPATVFVSLRPQTFHRSAKVGALSGYHPKAFTIAPPRIDQVIEKRLEFALKITSGQIPIAHLANMVQIQSSKLESVIRIFLFSLRENEKLVEFIDNISGGNVRQALELVRGFFGSGHMNTQEMIEIYENEGAYEIPLHHFLRAVMYGDGEHFDPEKSPIANLFDVSTSDPKAHFVLPLVIGVLASSASPGVEGGFVDASKVYEQLQGFGYTPDQIDRAILRGTTKNLIETVARRIPQPGQEMPQTLRATSIGVYHYTKLCRLFTYLDAMAVDMPIFDETARAIVRDVDSIGARLDRANAIRMYLDAQWGSMKGTEASQLFFWDAVSEELKYDMSRIRRRVDASRNERTGRQ